MNEKQKFVMDELLSGMDVKYQPMFLELAEYCVSLGYNPARNKTHDISIDFRNNKLKRTIMKMEANEQKHDGFKFGERKIPGLRLRFFATKKYSEIFKKGIQNVIEEFEGSYTGCYGCGKCGGIDGYTFVYPDGRQVYRCGSELISVFNFTENDISEIKELLKLQSDFYRKRYEN